MSDSINPNYYNKGNVECIDAMESAVIGKPPDEAIYVANIIKYLWRYESKGGLQDVQKAAQYMDRLLQKLIDKDNTKYRLIGTENGVALKTPWNTIMVPHDGDMFNAKDSARNALLNALLSSGGYCPCQVPQSEDTMCPCKNYREENKCICGLFVKVPQSVVNDNGENKVVGDDTNPEKGA